MVNHKSISIQLNGISTVDGRLTNTVQTKPNETLTRSIAFKYVDGFKAVSSVVVSVDGHQLIDATFNQKTGWSVVNQTSGAKVLSNVKPSDSKRSNDRIRNNFVALIRVLLPDVSMKFVDDSAVKQTVKKQSEIETRLAKHTAILERAQKTGDADLISAMTEMVDADKKALQSITDRIKAKQTKPNSKK